MATTVVTPYYLNAGYSALDQRVPRPLATTQVFNPALLVGLDAAGKATPFLTGTVAGIQYAVGLLDPGVTSGTFTSVAGQIVPVLTGVFSLANGTSGNAIVQASAGLAAYSADGLTANLTSATNPKVGGGTTTGKLLGVILGLDANIAGNILVSVIPEVNAAIVANGGVLPVPVTDGGTGAGTAAGARTNLSAAQSGVATGSAITPAGALSALISGATVSWASNVATISGGGAIVAAHALAGGIISDGKYALLITDNSALTATTGTITTVALTAVAPAALVATLSGATIGWSSNVGTISAGGAAVAAHALAGGIITDGTLFALITDNSTLTTSTGTITTITPAPTGSTISAYKAAPFTGSLQPVGTTVTAYGLVPHTHVQS